MLSTQKNIGEICQRFKASLQRVDLMANHNKKWLKNCECCGKWKQLIFQVPHCNFSTVFNWVPVLKLQHLGDMPHRFCCQPPPPTFRKPRICSWADTPGTTTNQISPPFILTISSFFFCLFGGLEWGFCPANITKGMDFNFFARNTNLCNNFHLILHGDMSPKRHVFYTTTVYLKLYAITKFIEKYKKKTAGKGSHAEETYKTTEPNLLGNLALKKIKNLWLHQK